MQLPPAVACVVCKSTLKSTQSNVTRQIFVFTSRDHAVPRCCQAALICCNCSESSACARHRYCTTSKQSNLNCCACFPRVSRAAVSTQTRGLKVGIIGAGRIGRVHLETLASVPGVQPVIISDVVESVLKEVTATYGVPNYTLNADEVINHPDVEAVWICSPSQFHADQIKACAKAGKHVFCEKPIATDLKGTVEAIQVAKDAGIKLMTAFQRRFDPSFARLQK
eukprot:1698-Heterococcus_DN1.PRE.1